MREINGAKSNLNKMVQYEALAGQGREGNGRERSQEGSAQLSPNRGIKGVELFVS